MLHGSQRLSEFYNNIKEINARNTNPIFLEGPQVKAAPAGQDPEEQQRLWDEP
jgi:hypothetical protein